MGEERSDPAIRGDRFSGGPARSFLSSMTEDAQLFAADLAVDRAHVVMLAEQGIIEDAVAGRILEALAAIETAGFDALPAGEDIHEAIESAVIERIGPDGGRMHTARSRNDEVATCIRYRLRELLLELATATLELRAVLIDLGDSHAETVAPGYTHLQPAQPTTVGHWALSYAGPLARDTTRQLETYERVNQSPLGGAALAGTTFPIDRERTAELLGFDGLVLNAMDAAASRDVVIEAAAVTASIATTLAGIAEDLLLSAHRDFVTLDDDYASTSSIMPQKKNPDTLELARAGAGEAIGALTEIQTIAKGLPRAYNRDLQRAHPPVFAALERISEATDVVGGALQTASWNEAALERAAADGFATVTGVADLLAANGMPFRTAHTVVASGVERAVEADIDPQDPDDRRRLVEIFAAITDDHAETSEPLEAFVEPSQVEQILDPAESVAARDSTGGPAPSAMAAQHTEFEQTLESDRAAVADHYAALANAETILAQEVATYG